MTAETKHRIFLSHGQILAFDGAMDLPFNDWTERHSAQGFAWRPGSVAFALLEEGGTHELCVDTDGLRDPLPDATRIIDVPFRAPLSGVIEIAGISERVEVPLAPGLYQLRFQNYPQIADEDPIISLSFGLSDAPHFKIVRADDRLHPGADLLLTASPA